MTSDPSSSAATAPDRRAVGCLGGAVCQCPPSPGTASHFLPAPSPVEYHQRLEALARSRLERVVKNHPGTRAAKRAQELLNKQRGTTAGRYSRGGRFPDRGRTVWSRRGLALKQATFMRASPQVLTCS
jgi:hypothetical protein